MTPVHHDQRIRAAAAGDDEALHTLVRVYHDRVYRFGTRVCSDPTDAEDVVQEAFVRLAHRPDVVRDAGALAWLFTTVRRACIRLARRLFHRRTTLGDRVDEIDRVASPAPGPDAALDRWRLVERVQAVIAALEPGQREVLVLRDLEGLSGDEVAARLGLSAAAMKSRLHRARAQVRAALTERVLDPS